MDVFAVEAFAASWIEIITAVSSTRKASVEAFAASWIEIVHPIALNKGHSVEAFAASWIEMDTVRPFCYKFRSKPLRLRGLKS